jgi:hypothetical protein
MSNKEIKVEIDKALEHLSDEGLKEVLRFLQNLDNEKPVDLLTSLSKILKEDHNLLVRLAQ